MLLRSQAANMEVEKFESGQDPNSVNGDYEYSEAKDEKLSL